ncbi:RNA polymerase sigma factor [Candidatus Enterococcus willemsii]|uniref:Uncharacterized protein n=1 Tax=Candidatus Enterococcus willemsii TaxID=1857215 RepID=A0ABQ6YZR8_9ENTE|nr:sigma-70 family RNA polymerase sigma factor [Enterococcus sp. CU12B]KAF1303997.1 hypothetical protein BAU17_03670 [Enterococcus sp. CU12B]
MSKKWIEQLIEEVYPSMLFYGLSLTKSHYEAEELVQEALYRFLLIYDQLEENNYRGWLFRVMRNYYFDNQRKAKRKKAALTDLARLPTKSMEDTLHQFIQSKEREQLYYAIDTLKEPYKEVLISYYFLEMSIKAIAEMTHMTPANIKVLLYRGRKQLKEVLTNEELS